MNRHTRMIERSTGVALTSNCRWRVGSVIARGNRIISFSANKFRNHPDIDHNNATFHAEIAAIKRAGQANLKGTTIYVSRVGKRGAPRMARPCPECMKTIVDTGIRNIVYTNELGRVSFERVE